ncbi:cobalt ECF transporter T component CbiQ [Lachnospiraceae bacterium JLR.KK008]
MRRQHVAHLEQYAYASGLRRRSAALKMVFSLAVLTLCLVLDSLAVSVFVILSMMVITAGIGRVKLREYFSLLGIPLFFVIFGGIALLVTMGSPLRAAEVTLRAVGAVSAFYFLALSTPVGELLAVLRKCHLPGLMIELMYLIYRFIFVLTEVWNHMDTAAQSRLGYVDYRTSLHTFGKVAGNLFVLSMRRADAFYNAMESRCYEGELCFLEKTAKSSLGEWAAAAGYVCVLVLIGRISG